MSAVTRTVERVTLADLADGDLVWAEGGFWPIRDVGEYPEYVGYTVQRGDRPSRLTGVPTTPILRVVR